MSDKVRVQLIARPRDGETWPEHLSGVTWLQLDSEDDSWRAWGGTNLGNEYAGTSKPIIMHVYCPDDDLPKQTGMDSWRLDIVQREINRVELHFDATISVDYIEDD